MSQTYTYGNTVLSLWQASVAEVQRRHVSVQSRMAPATSQGVAIAAQPAPADLMAPVGGSAVPPMRDKVAHGWGTRQTLYRVEYQRT
jgi:hypothetical protein